MSVARSLVMQLTLGPAALLIWGASVFSLPPDWKRFEQEYIVNLKSDKVETRRAAAAQLRQLADQAGAPRTPDAVAALIEALKDPDPIVRANAVESLPWVGGHSDNAPQVRAAIAKSDLPAILAAIKDQEAIVRAKAAGALAIVNADAKTSVTTLTDLLNDPNVSVRTAVVRSLAGISRKADVLPSVLLALKDKDGGVRAATVQALGAVGIQREEVVSAIIDSLRDSDPVVQSAAADELGNRLRGNSSGPNTAKNVVPVLVELAGDKSYPSRSAVVRAIGQISPDATIAVPVLTECLKDPDAQQAAVAALLQYGMQAKAAIPNLRELAKTAKTAKSDSAGSLAVVGLVRIDPDSEETWTAFKGCSANDRQAVTRGLLRIDREAKDKSTLKAILVLLQDPDVKVRAASVELLARKFDPDAQSTVLPLLLTMLKNKEARAGDLAEALGPMKALAKEAVPDLLKAFAVEKDEEESERILYALQRIDLEAAKKAKKTGKP